MADKFIQFESFMRRFQIGKFVELDLTGMKPIVQKMRNTFRSVIDQRGNLRRAIHAGSELAMQRVSKAILREYQKRLAASDNPIAQEVLDVLEGVCQEMEANPSKYFDVRPEGKESIIVRARPFNLEVFNTQTRKIRQRYYRRAGIVRTKKRDIKIPGVFVDNPLHGMKSSHVGMGVLFEFGRTSAGTIRPKQEKKSQYFSVVDNNSILGQTKKGNVKLGNKRSALLIPAGKGEYVFRRYSRWGASKGMHKIFTQKNVLRAMYKTMFIKTLSGYLKTSGFNVNVTGV